MTPSILGEDQTQYALSGSTLYAAPNATTTYTATATNAANQTASASATITVAAPTLTANPTLIPAGQSSTLTWTAPNNGSTLTLTGIPGGPITLNAATGSMQVQPGTTTTYTLTDTGPNGGAATAQATVTVQNPVQVTLTPKTQTIQPGASANITWSTQNALSLTINGQNVTPVGGGVYNTGPLNQTTTFTAIATDRFNLTATATATVIVSSGGPSNINHVIFMLQENRAFDNYFGELAEYRVNHNPPIQGAKLSDVDDMHNLPPGFTLTNPENQKFAPFHARTECTENLSPSWDESHYDEHITNGDFLHLDGAKFLMDRFLDTTGSVEQKYDTTQTRPLGYYDQTDLPFYYELAARFATSDRHFSPLSANTVPNRMYMFAATSFGHAFPPNSGHEAYTQATIFRALTQAGITWRYYYQDNSVFLSEWADWNDPNIRGNVRSIQEWYTILASPTADHDLPQVVFIERAGATGLDEHPENNIQKGSALVQQIMTALFNSGAWNDSAFILSFDEGGGLFDHVPPFQEVRPDDIDPQDLGSKDIPGRFDLSGFRVPFIVVSPWVKANYVSHTPMDNTAILKMIESRFNVPALTARDAAQPDMWTEYFDWSGPNLLNAWQGLPTQPTNGTCDQTLESSPNEGQ
jgi:phospholipase C